MTQPKPTGGPDGTFSAGDLRRIILYQRIALVCAILYASMMFLGFFFPNGSEWVLELIVYPIVAVCGIFVFLLAIKIHGAVVGLILTFISLTPCVGLCVFLLISHQTAEILKRHGIPATLFGARRIPPSAG